MLRTAHCILASAALVLLLAAPPTLRAQTSLHPTAIEIAELPHFCWGQLQIPNATTDEFHIIGCGPAANHYCSALIYMLRAKGHVSKNTRMGLLGMADADIRYTEKAIAGYPTCNIRDHVASSRTELEDLMRVFGYNRPRAK
jgi:hypothetical protein